MARAGWQMRSFGLTWDYRCPFAFHAHHAVIEALRSGAPWDVEFLAFSLDQVHVEEGEPAVWERPTEARGSGVLPLEWGIAVRDRFPDSFFDFHLATFAARFDGGQKIGREEALAAVAESVGLDPALVAKEVAQGWPLETLAEEHTRAVQRWSVFGTPTAVVGDEAIFFRLMERGRVDDLERVLELMDAVSINEFKRTRLTA